MGGIIATDHTAAPDILDRCPTAPITIVPVESRGELDQVIENVATHVSLNGFDRGSALDAAEHFSLERYGRDLDLALK
jgi:hypothetical protein